MVPSDKLLPPLIIGDEEVEMIVPAFDEVLTDAEHFPGRVWSLSGQLVKETARG